MNSGEPSAVWAGRRVLVVSAYWTPEVTGSGPYLGEIGAHLAALGAEVRALTTHPHYPRWRLPEGTPNRRAQELRDGVEVTRLPVALPARPNLVARARYEAGFLARASVHRTAPVDIVVGCSPTLGAAVAAARHAGRSRSPLALVVHDLVGAAAGQSGFSGAGRVAGLLAAAEHRVFRKAGLLLPCSPAFVPRIADAGVAAERIVVVRPWAKELPVPGDREQRRRELGWHGREVLLHTGNMGLKQGLDELVPSLAALASAEPEVLVVFVGDGNQAAELRAAVDGLPNVSIRPLLSPGDYQRTLAAADVCLLHERSTSADMSMPSKLGSYFTAGRPVLAVARADGSAAAEVRAAGAGIVVPQRDPAAFVEAVRRLVDRDLADELGRRGRSYAARELDREEALGRITQHLDELIRRGPPG